LTQINLFNFHFIVQILIKSFWWNQFAELEYEYRREIITKKLLLFFARITSKNEKVVFLVNIFFFCFCFYISSSLLRSQIDIHYANETIDLNFAFDRLQNLFYFCSALTSCRRPASSFTFFFVLNYRKTMKITFSNHKVKPSSEWNKKKIEKSSSDCEILCCFYCDLKTTKIYGN
jgi:hypothetical protein